MPHHARSQSRRRSSRLETSGAVWVIWSCEGCDETSPVLDLSPGGLFIETRRARSVGLEVNLEFLVQEGQIRARAVVRHVEPGRGFGLRFKAITGADAANLVGLINRLRLLDSQ